MLLALTMAVVGVKLMKAAPQQSEPRFEVQLPADCAGCSVVDEQAFTGENPREIYFHLRVPAANKTVPGFRVRVHGVPVRAVIVEKSRIPFTTVADAVVFDLPVEPRARSSTVEVQTSLEWPGIVLRIEHAFVELRAGKYAAGEFPVMQRAAALNLEFGLREAIRNLKLDQEVAGRGLGKIHLMGFDTNNPLGHEDYPPHIHMILRWPHFAGSQAPHYYISDRGLLLPDVSVTIDGMPYINATKAGRGTWLPAVDYLGETLYETQVGEGGDFAIRRPGGAACSLKPLETGNTGFASGVVVACGGARGRCGPVTIPGTARFASRSTRGRRRHIATIRIRRCC